jgi:hypothetical protein
MGRVKKKTKEFEKRRRRRREGIGEKRREEKEIPRTYHKLHAAVCGAEHGRSR